MNRIRRSPLDHASLFREVVTDDDFEKFKETEKPHRAFALTAIALAEIGTCDNGYRTKTADQLHIAATTADYVRAVEMLATNETVDDDGNIERQLSYDDRKKYAEDTVVFNHALEALIDNDPGANYKEVVEFVFGMYRSLFRKDTPEQQATIRAHIEQTLNGIRGEVIGEQLLSHLGYDVEDVSVQDDLRGIDRFVHIDGKKHGVDFKVDPRYAAKKRLKSPGSLTLTVPVSEEVIGTKFRLDAEDVPRYARYLESELAQEWQRYTSHHASQEAARRAKQTERRDANRSNHTRTRTHR